MSINRSTAAHVLLRRSLSDRMTSRMLIIIYIHSFIHSFIMETYIAPLQDTTTQRCSQPSHGQRRTLSILTTYLQRIH